jgi:hypothetical protein
MPARPESARLRIPSSGISSQDQQDEEHISPFRNETYYTISRCQIGDLSKSQKNLEIGQNCGRS